MKASAPGAGAPVCPPVQHGGPDAAGVPTFDFSTNGNAAGPLPSVARAVADADHTRYPDPDYHVLRERLAGWHRVDAARIVIAGSASEFIQRLTRVVAHRRRVRRALLPNPCYSDYAAAAYLAGVATASWLAEVDMSIRQEDDVPALHDGGPFPEPSAGDLYWLTEPMSPTGRTLGRTLGATIGRAVDAGAIVALDLAYQPLRFDGFGLAPEADRAWQLWSPNKSCGLTGVRAAYAIAPRGEEALAQALRTHAASWIAGADGVAMLTAFAAPAAHAELALQLPCLHAWRDALAAALRDAGWHVADAISVTPFFVARAPQDVDAGALRACGIKLRPTGSMGLPGWLRLSAQPPAAVEALIAACRARSAGRAR